MVAGRGKRAARKKVAGRTEAATMRDSEDHQGLTLVLSCPLSSVAGGDRLKITAGKVLYYMVPFCLQPSLILSYGIEKCRND